MSFVAGFAFGVIVGWLALRVALWLLDVRTFVDEHRDAD